MSYKDNTNKLDNNYIQSLLEVKDYSKKALFFDLFVLTDEKPERLKELRNIAEKWKRENMNLGSWSKDLPPTVCRIMEIMIKSNYMKELPNGTLQWNFNKRSACATLKEFLTYIDKEILHKKQLQRCFWAEIFNVETKFFQIKVNKTNNDIIELHRFLSAVEKYLDIQTDENDFYNSPVDFHL